MNTSSGNLGRAQDALAPIMDYIRAQLDASTGVFLDRAQKTLNDTWPQIREAKKQDDTRYAASWLSSNKQRVLSAMHDRLVGALNQAPEEPKIPEDIGELRLMDAETLAAHLLRARMVSRVMEKGRADFTALEQRFEHLQQTGLMLNPRALNPGALADGFLNVLRDLQVPDEVQALLLEAYGDLGVKLMIEFYQGINRVMLDHGIAPELRIANNRTIGHRQPSAAAQPGAPADARAQAVQQLLGQISRGEWQPGLFRQLLDWQFAQAGGVSAPGATPATGAVPAGMAMPAGAMHSATQAIAASLAPGADAGVQVPGIPVAVTIDAIRDLAGLLSPTILLDPRSLSSEQSKAIDHLESRSFELLRDERISPRVRAQLSRLIPPLLAAQLSFPGAFGAPDNPARVFVRQLALLGYRDQEFPIADFDAVEIVVDRILAEEGREVDSFRSGAEVLYTLARQEVKRRIAAATLERAKKAEDADGHEEDALVAEARHQVAIELADRAAGLELAPAAADFVRDILGPWMMSRYHKYGAMSPQWKDARGFATRFFESIQPAVDDADQERKQTVRARTLVEAKLHAQRTSLPAAQSARLIASLERHLQYLGVMTPEERPRPAQRTTPIDFLRDLPRTL